MLCKAKLNVVYDKNTSHFEITVFKHTRVLIYYTMDTLARKLSILSKMTYITHPTFQKKTLT